MTVISSQAQTKPQTWALDDLIQETGKFGRYQVFIYVLLAFPILLAGSNSVSFVFTAGDLNYRCRIPECDVPGRDASYNPSWLREAVPFKNNLPVNCYRYNNSGTSCEANSFVKSEQLKCIDFIYETDERTLVNEFNLTCDENKWVLAFVGTTFNIALFFNCLTSGYISDRFGRKSVIIFSFAVAGICGLIKSFAWSYLTYVIAGFLEALLGAGIYTAVFIMLIEISSPETRSWGGVMTSIAASTGKLFLGLIAMLTRDWQTIIRFISLPSFIFLVYYWLIPESMRWLLSRNRNKEAATILLYTAKCNKVVLTEDVHDILVNYPENITINDGSNTDCAEKSKLIDIFKHPTFVIRLCAVAFCWIVNVFVNYGLTYSSVAIGGNKYTDFMWISVIELPAQVFVLYSAERIGRKIVLIGAFVTCGVAILTGAFIRDQYLINLSMMCVGKLAISISFSTLYIFTSEIFPTHMRQTLFGLCSAVGRIGSIVATQASVLQSVKQDLPQLLFGTVALIGALVCLIFPETLGTHLPDTIVQAVDIGKKIKCKESKLETF